MGPVDVIERETRGHVRRHGGTLDPEKNQRPEEQIEQADADEQAPGWCFGHPGLDGETGGEMSGVHAYSLRLPGGRSSQLRMGTGTRKERKTRMARHGGVMREPPSAGEPVPWPRGWAAAESAESDNDRHGPQRAALRIG